jgi:p-hydroxybenzoate 3-monooxygenase
MTQDARPADGPVDRVRTQVAIIGGGPAGLLLSLLLRGEGISSVIVERRSAAHVAARVRAGVLEQGTVEVLTRAGVGERLAREGQRHGGFHLASDGRACRIALDELIGRHVTVYGQTEVTKDLMAAHRAAGTDMRHEAQDVALHDLETDRPHVTFTHDGRACRVEADFIAGCDGFHGVSRRSIPADRRREVERVHPFGWLGILADAPPCQDELVYASSARGFALASMRSPTRSRYYIQCRPDEPLDAWPDDRLWAELKLRLGQEIGARVTTGPVIEKSVAALRSFVCETMRFGRLFLLGDAAHIVPPTGAKGLNLAVGDARYLATALTAFYRRGEARGVERYAEVALRRVWKAERFSWSLTSLLHDGADDDFGRRMRMAELDYVFSSRAAQTVIAENYVGLPYEDVLGP